MRMALGATRGSILKVIVGHGMRPVACGFAAGIAMSGGIYVAGRPFIEGLLPLARLSEVVAFLALLAAMCVVACCIPGANEASVESKAVLRDL